MQGETGTVNYTQIKAIEGKTKVFSEELKDECFEFAERVVGNKKTLMSQRHQTDSSLWVQQHAYGKLQEWAVYRLLHPYGCSEVDFTIHKYSRHDPDLTLDSWKLDCKSVKIPSYYGISFTFQADFINNDYDRLFDRGDERDIVICGTVDPKNNIIEIVDVNLWNNVKPYVKFIDGRDKPDLKNKKQFYNPSEAKRERETS